MPSMKEFSNKCIAKYHKDYKNKKEMSKTIMKYLLALCLICNVGNAFAQHRYYCEVKGIEKDLSSGLKIIFDFGTKASYNICKL